MSVLVLGVGNILMGDEAIGVRVVEALEGSYQLPASVRVVDGGTAGMGLLDLIAGVEHVIIVDVVKAGAEPGTIVRLEGDQVPVGFRQRVSPHSLGLGDVLAVLTVLDQAPKDLIVIGIEPYSLDFGIGLSPLIAARQDALLATVVAELERLGVIPQPVRLASRAET